MIANAVFPMRYARFMTRKRLARRIHGIYGLFHRQNSRSKTAPTNNLKDFGEASAVAIGLQVLIKHHGDGAHKEPAGISDLQAVFF